MGSLLRGDLEEELVRLSPWNSRQRKKQAGKCILPGRYSVGRAVRERCNRWFCQNTSATQTALLHRGKSNDACAASAA